MNKIQINTSIASLECVINTLLMLKNNVYSAYCKFTKHINNKDTVVILDSNSITMNNAYRKVYGMTKSKFEKTNTNSFYGLVQDKDKATTRIERAIKLVHPEKIESVAEWILTNIHLEHFSTYDFKRIISMALSFILHFSKIGPDFYVAMMNEELSPQDLKIINNLREKNKLTKINTNIRKLKNEENVFAFLFPKIY